MNNWTLALCLSAIAWTGSPVRADAPKPSPTPISWELQVELSEPVRIVVSGESAPKTYWYFLYSVVNNTDRDVPFHPEIVRVNEIDSETTAKRGLRNPDIAARLSVDVSLIGVHPRVFRAIRDKHKKTHPFMVSPIEAIGPLLQGRDNARTSVAIFPELDPRVANFTVYFGGLSGERVTRPNPGYDKLRAAERKSRLEELDVKTQKNFVLRKTLALPYTLPGDVNTRRVATPVLGRSTWVMR